jgi:hypothetical protein
MSGDDFEKLGLSMVLSWNENRCNEKNRLRRFKAFFGTCPAQVAMLWNSLHQNWLLSHVTKPQPKHLLWALLFLKDYGTEEKLAALVGGVDTKTFRKWTWTYVKAVAGLSHIYVSGFMLGVSKEILLHSSSNFVSYCNNEQIKWNNRFVGDIHNVALTTVDGTDFKINEPWPFTTENNKKWYSHKFKHAGVRYEVAISILTGYIVWIHGPFPCGLMPDIRIFRMKLADMLFPGEKVVADAGYKGEPNVCIPLHVFETEHQHPLAKARARHENVNGRFKTWGVLRDAFRHKRNKHVFCFKAVAAITQLEIETGAYNPFQITDYSQTALIEIESNSDDEL